MASLTLPIDAALEVNSIAIRRGFPMTASKWRELVDFLRDFFEGDDMSELSLNSSCHSVEVDEWFEPIDSHPAITCWCCSFNNKFENAKCDICDADLILGFITHKMRDFRFKRLNPHLK